MAEKELLEALLAKMNGMEKKIDRIAADVTFLVRKAAEHEDDIRSLRQIK